RAGPGDPAADGADGPGWPRGAMTEAAATVSGARAPVPLQVPWYGPEEEAAVATALREGTGVGAGPIGRRVEQEMARLFGVRHVLLTSSATHALELAVLALGLGPGDEVILPSFTFSSCANAVTLRGARPVF